MVIVGPVSMDPPPPLGGRYMYFGHESAKVSTREWQPAGNKAVAYHYRYFVNCQGEHEEFTGTCED